MLKSWKPQLRGLGQSGCCILIDECLKETTSKKFYAATLLLRLNECRSKLLKSRLRFNAGVTGAEQKAERPVE